MKDLTLIIPAKNESESLPKVLYELKNFDCKILVSLQKNDKETIAAIKYFNVEIYTQNGKGYGNSLVEGINNCKTNYFCIFNADGSFEANDLYEMYKLIQDKDFVYTSRYLQGGNSDDDTIITLVGNKIFSFLGKLLFSLNISDMLYTYLMGRTNSFNKLKINSSDFRFCVELPIKMHLAGMKYTSIPSKEKKRIAGKKKVNAFKDGFLILAEMLKLFFNNKILRQKKVD
jgi:glycosyltransferase involved in cell wall biosynthesis